ncbi:DUF4349 domain-containing protein [Alkalihalobacillus sp. MEB130]|uniref:DUF4349 domain-containing protein n=1 Tax=Alkalihalobacillus sp. MEB130 TaxID=2976704 RepID=UPI0028DEDB90|nr:DUF4349 domain-containing protein [Alkalihalobacillus sp. MEB130]MDT8860631.1 DUF4349 domain-containing protein [Alkalihalobacillus sp. MEB130]
MRKTARLLAIIFVVFVVSACRSQQDVNELAVMDQEIMSVEEAASTEEAELLYDNVLNQNRSTETERMVIYHGYLTMEVKDYLVTREVIQAKAEQLGGYVVESHYNEDAEGGLFGTVVLRIPKQDFQPFIEEIGTTENVKVTEQSTHGNDITEEYVDLESRLKAKRVVEERLLGFLEEADSTESLLKISTELANVQEEIEQMVGRQRFLENQVELSTLTITIHEVSIGTSTIQGDQLNTWERSKKMFIDTINVLLRTGAAIVVWLIGLSPIFLSLGLILFIILMFYKRKKNKRKQPLDS